MPNKYGVNFGISLSVWDYIFKTNYIPKDGRDIELGFNDENEFPHDFIKQVLSLKKILSGITITYVYTLVILKVTMKNIF
jgi:sterol desaturase/sphingolipid hydroxylase (fatty acid hydroxylase superfamily)